MTTKAEMMQWRRSKVIELSSQGKTQPEIADTLQVGLGTVNRDIQYIRNEARESLKDYTTKKLPFQFRLTIVATQNALKQYWNIAQNAHDDRDKILALEHYLDCHKRLCNLLDSEETLQPRFDNGNSRHESNPNDNLRWIEDGDMITPVNGCALWIYRRKFSNGNDADNGNGNGE